MLSLPAHAWVPLLAHLTAAEVAVMRCTHSAVRSHIATAQCLAVDTATAQACLLTRAYCADGTEHTIVARPTPQGYHLLVALADGRPRACTPVCRRMFVHEFPVACCRMLGDVDGLDRIQSFLAFDSCHSAPLSSLALLTPLASLAFVTAYDPLAHMDAWVNSKLVTHATHLPKSQWHQLFQTHARFLVNFRMGRPRTRAARRARVWSKVTQTRDAGRECGARDCVACGPCGAGSAA